MGNRKRRIMLEGSSRQQLVVTRDVAIPRTDCHPASAGRGRDGASPWRERPYHYHTAQDNYEARADATSFRNKKKKICSIIRTCTYQPRCWYSSEHDSEQRRRLQVSNLPATWVKTHFYKPPRCSRLARCYRSTFAVIQISTSTYSQ